MNIFKYKAEYMSVVYKNKYRLTHFYQRPRNMRPWCTRVWNVVTLNKSICLGRFQGGMQFSETYSVTVTE